MTLSAFYRSIELDSIIPSKDSVSWHVVNVGVSYLEASQKPLQLQQRLLQLIRVLAGLNMPLPNKSTISVSG